MHFPQVNNWFLGDPVFNIHCRAPAGDGETYKSELTQMDNCGHVIMEFILKGIELMPTATVYQCTRCAAMWTKQTLIDAACPECSGEVKDISDTHTGQEFLRIVKTPDEIRFTNMDKKISYASGASSIFSSIARGS